MLLKEACQLASDIAGVEISILSNEQEYVAFCERYRFHSMQEYLCTDVLEQLREESGNEVLCTFDQFQVRFIFYAAYGQLLAIGPYCTEFFTKNDCELLLRRVGLSELDARDLASYRSAIPVMPENEPLHLLRCIAKNMEWEIPPGQNSSRRFEPNSLHRLPGYIGSQAIC